MTYHFHAELNKLKEQILFLGCQVEENLVQAVQAVHTNNKDLAQKVREADDIIDQKEIEVEEECLKILALHQPLAKDLRYVIAVLKITNDLERIGDLAANIAKAVKPMIKTDDDIVFDFASMAETARLMLHNALKALIESDVNLAREVCALDDKVDDLNKATYTQVTERIQAAPEKASYFMYNMGISRNLERIADHATNIAEDVIYMIEGNIIRHSHDS